MPQARQANVDRLDDLHRKDSQIRSGGIQAGADVWYLEVEVHIARFLLFLAYSGVGSRVSYSRVQLEQRSFSSWELYSISYEGS